MRNGILVDWTDTTTNRLPTLGILHATVGTVGPVVEFVSSTVAPNLETLGYIPLPAGAIQCRIDYLFAQNRQDAFIVEECCKCQTQTKCQTASGATHYNIVGSYAMMQPNETVDKSKFSNSKTNPSKSRYN